jgi:hypothetical protein
MIVDDEMTLKIVMGYTHWLVGWLVNRVVGWLVGQLVGWLIYNLRNQQT